MSGAATSQGARRPGDVSGRAPVVATKPQRIQRKRSKGWRMPVGAVYVGRPTKWGNPFRLDVPVRRTAVIASYKDALERGLLAVTTTEVRSGLRGKDLVCWCRLGDACHADVLLEVANRIPDELRGGA